MSFKNGARPGLPGARIFSVQVSAKFTSFCACFCRIYQFWCSFVCISVAFAGFCKMSCHFFDFLEDHLQSPFRQFFSIYVACSPLACPLGRLGPLPLPRVFLSNQDKTMKLEQTPWNVTGWFAGNQKKRNSCIRKSEKKKPLYFVRTPSIFACLSHGVDLKIIGQYFVSYS